MDRRAFTLSLASSVGLAMPTIATANKISKDSFPSFGRIRLKVGGRVRPATRLVIVSGDELIEFELKRQFPLSNENRSSLLEPTLAKKFRKGVVVGPVLTDGSQIALKADRALDIEELSIADQDISYRITSEPSAPRKAPSSALNKFGTVIGSAMLRGSSGAFAKEILVQVKHDILIQEIRSGS